jgi:hypothetical protein
MAANFSFAPPQTLPAQQPTPDDSSSSSERARQRREFAGDTRKLAALAAAWADEVRAQRDAFRRQAEQVRRWDEQLRGARVGVLRLSEDLRALLREQEDVDHALRHVEQHNERLERALGDVELFLDRALGGEGGTAGGGGGGTISLTSVPAPQSALQASAQQARAEAYEQALRIDALLRGLGGELREVNALVERGLAQDAGPLEQAKRVLVAEMNNLVEIERVAGEALGRARRLRDTADALRAGGSGRR